MFRHGLKILLFLLVTGWGLSVSRADSGEDVVVVYNDRMPESKRVAEHYALKRKVPKEQVIGLHLSKEEIITRDEYRKELEEPLWKALLMKKLFTLRDNSSDTKLVVPSVASAKVKYAVLCYGVPLKISHQADLSEPGVDKLPSELKNNAAAVDNELALLPMRTRTIRLAGPLSSPFYGTTNAAQLHPTNGLLMVTRLDGPSEETAKGLVDKALEAERDGLWGRSYVDLRDIKDGQYKQGDDWIKLASEVTSKLGWETIVDNKPETFPRSFPMSQIGFYFGWYDGTVSGPFTWGQTEFMPGAFAYHLHSYSAATLRDKNQNWVAPFLARGATATMGNVYEPYLSGTPDVGTFTARWLHHRMTFGQAAYACTTVLSWQTTFVGDPLYQPMGMLPQVRHAELMTKSSPLIAWSHLKVVNLNLVSGMNAADMIGYLQKTPETQTSSVLQEKLGDLYLQDKRPTDALKAYEAALALKITKKQELRLLFAKGDVLTSLEKAGEAVDAYLKIESTYPDYPDMPALYQKLLPVAQKAKRNDVVERCQKGMEKKQ